MRGGKVQAVNVTPTSKANAQGRERSIKFINLIPRFVNIIIADFKKLRKLGLREVNFEKW